MLDQKKIGGTAITKEQSDCSLLYPGPQKARELHQSDKKKEAQNKESRKIMNIKSKTSRKQTKQCNRQQRQKKMMHTLP